MRKQFPDLFDPTEGKQADGKRRTKRLSEARAEFPELFTDSTSSPFAERVSRDRAKFAQWAPIALVAVYSSLPLRSGSGPKRTGSALQVTEVRKLLTNLGTDDRMKAVWDAIEQRLRAVKNAKRQPLPVAQLVMAIVRAHSESTRPTAKRGNEAVRLEEAAKLATRLRTALPLDDQNTSAFRWFEQRDAEDALRMLDDALIDDGDWLLSAFEPREALASIVPSSNLRQLLERYAEDAKRRAGLLRTETLIQRQRQTKNSKQLQFIRAVEPAMKKLCASSMLNHLDTIASVALDMPEIGDLHYIRRAVKGFK
jgi:hypothetical protein